VAVGNRLAKTGASNHQISVAYYGLVVSKILGGEICARWRASFSPAGNGASCSLLSSKCTRQQIFSHRPPSPGISSPLDDAADTHPH
jgi:hypothetical protein